MDQNKIGLNIARKHVSGASGLDLAESYKFGLKLFIQTQQTLCVYEGWGGAFLGKARFWIEKFKTNLSSIISMASNLTIASDDGCHCALLFESLISFAYVDELIRSIGGTVLVIFYLDTSKVT